MRRIFGALAAAVAFLAVPASASAAITSVFGGQTIAGGAVPCTAGTDGVRSCHGADGGGGSADLRLKSFDGSPLEVYVILPPAPSSGPDGPYPLIVQSHGWGGSAGGPNATDYSGPTADAWAKQGFAVLQLTARGFGDSCGTAASRLAAPLACMNGYIRLDDDRYEVRDIQYAAGLLVDSSVVDPARIGATGPSYGGGVSLQLATLKDRVMLTDGSLAPWRSPGGTSIHLAAAAPVIPWSDLTYSLMPNGRTLDYEVTSPTADLSPIGVSKQSFTGALYGLGTATGYYSTPHSNPEADLTSWFATINAGEPYDTNAGDQMIAQTIARYHSAYYLLDGAYGAASEAPAPLLIANGFTDDLFPVDEGVRFYDLERSRYPANPVALFEFDGGHMRGQNKPADQALLSDRIQSFLSHYLNGAGAQPQLGATALTQTCPSTAPSGGPFSAPTWAALHPGEVDLTSSSPQTVASNAGDPTIAKTIDPIAGGGACATVSSTDQGSGVATYRLPASTGSGYTLLGSPTVVATLHVSGTYPLIAARLWDVDQSSHTQSLVARGVYRLDSNRPDGVQVFQLHPGAWHFAAGHVPKLELLGQDAPYARASNGSFQITVSDLQLRLPVHEQPGGAGVPAVVTKPKSSVTSRPHACLAYPFSRIMRTAFGASGPHRRGPISNLEVSGVASEQPCANASAKTRRLERVAHVFVMIYRHVAHRRCRFVSAGGKLSKARSCSRPIELRARGTAHWTLRVRTIPMGQYLIRSDAVDRLHHHQRPAGKTVWIGRVK